MDEQTLVIAHYGGEDYFFYLNEEETIPEFLKRLGSGDRGTVIEAKMGNGQQAFLLYTKGTPIAVFKA